MPTYGRRALATGHGRTSINGPDLFLNTDSTLKKMIIKMPTVIRRARGKVLSLGPRIKLVRDIEKTVTKLFYVSHEIKTVRSDVYELVAKNLGMGVTPQLIRYVNKCLVKKGAVISYRAGSLVVKRVRRRDNV